MSKHKEARKKEQQQAQRVTHSNIQLYKTGAMLFIFLMFVMSVFPVQSSDLLLYLSVARHYFQTGTFPNQDPFLFSIPNYQWHMWHSWLTYFISYALFQLGGFTTLILAKAGFLLISPIVLFGMARRLNYRSPLIFIVGMLALFAAAYRFIERSSIFTDVFTLLVLAILLLEQVRPSKIKYALPFVFLLWVNTHPGFPVGLLLCAIFLAANISAIANVEYKRLAIVSGVSVLACLINPLGLRGFLFPFIFSSREAQVYKLYYSEWLPAFHPNFSSTLEVRALVFLIALSSFFVLVSLLANKRPWFEILALALLSYLGLSAVRFVSTVSFPIALICIALASQLDALNLEGADIHLRRGTRAILIGSVVLISTLLLKTIIWGYTSPAGLRQMGFGLHPLWFPIGATEALERTPYSGNLFNSHDFGSYLMWTWNGQRKLFYHGAVTDLDFYQNEYLAPQRSPSEFQRIVKKYNIGAFMLDPQEGGIQNLLATMSTDPTWKLVYQDAAGLLFVKKN